MIAEDFRFEGFDARAFAQLLKLFRADDRIGAAIDPAAPRRRGTLIVVRDEDDQPIAALVTGRGPVPVTAWRNADELSATCARLGAERAVVLLEGAIEELTERAAERVPMPGDYAAQWLSFLGLVRELEDEGRIMFWPRRGRLPLPTGAVVNRALDMLLPDDHCALVALWDGQEMATAIAIHRRGYEIDHIVGPEVLLSWTGPLGGDFRRDYRALTAAVTRALGPVHIGLFAQHREVEQLLRSADPGAWARAVALRELILSPAPSYAHVAVGADAARAAGRRARAWLGGLDLFGALAPAVEFAREHVARVGSISQLLGFNPIEALGTRLRGNAEGAVDEDDAVDLGAELDEGIFEGRPGVTDAPPHGMTDPPTEGRTHEPPPKGTD